MNSYFFKSALLPNGWQHNVRATTEQGVFTTIETDVQFQEHDTQLDVVIPAMPNAHSHVFQRAMAGLSEYKGADQDSFWSWRDLMYQLAADLDIESLYQDAVNCYTEMRHAGYASVCEFHYVHRSLDDSADYKTHSEVLLKAAADVGLPITLLPVLYAYAGVGEKPLSAAQERFELSTDEYITLFTHLQTKLQANQQLGICFHSIRAVNQQQMQTVLTALPKDVPIHIHIAEQQAEVDQSLAHYGVRPVQWLFDHFEVNQHWNLVHATHLNEEEIQLMAKSGAVAVLCPLTEANLGDGIFPMPAFKEAGGTWSIGSDSHIEIQPQQELKMLEYSQRLRYQQRNICTSEKQPHVGTWMWLQAIHGGALSTGQKSFGLVVGASSQVIELQSRSAELTAAAVLDDWIFSDRTAINSQQL